MDKSNLDLAREAFNALEELVNRGNKQLESSRGRVSSFYSECISLQHRARELEREADDGSL